MCILFEAVTSFADVWIEIIDDENPWLSVFVTTFVDVWIEMANCIKSSRAMPGHILHGCVD